MSKKQTAVELLTDKIVEILGDKCNELTQEQTLSNHYAIKQALQLEREQIEKAFDRGERREYRNYLDGEQYYTKTYGEFTPLDYKGR